MVTINCCETCKYLSQKTHERKTESNGDTMIYTCRTLGKCLKTGETMLGSDICNRFVLDYDKWDDAEIVYTSNRSKK
jgi:hypothetical protein